MYVYVYLYTYIHFVYIYIYICICFNISENTPIVHCVFGKPSCLCISLQSLLSESGDGSMHGWAETDCGNRAGLPLPRHPTLLLMDEAQLPPSFPDLYQHSMCDVCLICDM